MNAAPRIDAKVEVQLPEPTHPCEEVKSAPLIRRITLQQLKDRMHLPIKTAAKELHTSDSNLKKICRWHDVRIWPSRQIQAKMRAISSLESKNKENNLSPKTQKNTELEIQKLQRSISELKGHLSPNISGKRKRIICRIGAVQEPGDERIHYLGETTVDQTVTKRSNDNGRRHPEVYYEPHSVVLAPLIESERCPRHGEIELIDLLSDNFDVTFLTHFPALVLPLAPSERPIPPKPPPSLHLQCRESTATIGASLDGRAEVHGKSVNDSNKENEWNNKNFATTNNGDQERKIKALIAAPEQRIAKKKAKKEQTKRVIDKGDSKVATTKETGEHVLFAAPRRMFGYHFDLANSVGNGHPPHLGCLDPPTSSMEEWKCWREGGAESWFEKHLYHSSSAEDRQEGKDKKGPLTIYDFSTYMINDSISEYLVPSPGSFLRCSNSPDVTDDIV